VLGRALILRVQRTVPTEFITDSWCISAGRGLGSVVPGRGLDSVDVRSTGLTLGASRRGEALAQLCPDEIQLM